MLKDYEVVLVNTGGRAVELAYGQLVRDDDETDIEVDVFRNYYEAKVREYLDSGTGIVEVRVAPEYRVTDYPLVCDSGAWIGVDFHTNLPVRYDIGWKIISARCRLWREGSVAPVEIPQAEGGTVKGVPERFECGLGFDRDSIEAEGRLFKVIDQELQAYIDENGLETGCERGYLKYYGDIYYSEDVASSITQHDILKGNGYVADRD